jgi:hypothetical protein
LKKIRRGYIIGSPPIFDPCEECLVKVTCQKYCNDKILFDANRKTDKPLLKIKVKNVRRR